MKCEINFFNENVSYVIRKKGELRKWLTTVVESEGRVAGTLNLILCDDDILSELNYKYLKHKTLTDILTFSFEDQGGRLTGDIFISVPRVKENAIKFNQKVEDELHRVMVHGLLHLAGYNDMSSQDKIEMTKKEDYYLGLLPPSMYSFRVV